MASSADRAGAAASGTTQASLVGAAADADVAELKDRLGALTGILAAEAVNEIAFMYEVPALLTKPKKGANKMLPGRIIVTLNVDTQLWAIEHVGDRQKTYDVKTMMRKMIRLPPRKEDARKFMAAQGQKLHAVVRKTGFRYKWMCDAAIGRHATFSILRMTVDPKPVPTDTDPVHNVPPNLRSEEGAPWMVELAAHARPDTLQEIGADLFRKSVHVKPLVVWS